MDGLALIWMAMATGKLALEIVFLGLSLPSGAPS
jgi:hypothetical protein